MRKVRPSLIAGPLLFLVGLIALSVAFFAMRAPQTAETAALVGGPFALVDQDNRPVTEASLKGKPFLVFFGFTHCPDICPTKLYEMSQVLDALKDDLPELEALFVTVDPERDTPDVLKRYLASFNPKIRALTGDNAAVGNMIKTYRAYAKQVPTESGGYTMDHTSIVYLMDSQGSFASSLDMTKDPRAIADEIESRL